MISTGRIVVLVLCALLVIVGLSVAGSLVEGLGAEDIMVIQYLNGTLAVSTDPGWKAQWLGKVTKYKKRDQFWFRAPKAGTKDADESIGIQFNDAARARLSGGISWVMPLDTKSIVDLHVTYGSHDAVERNLIRPTIEKTVYMTGPLMSSQESYAARKNELLAYIEDQLQNGIYRTEVEQARVKDLLSGQERTVGVVKIIEQGGRREREDLSALARFKVTTFALSINDVIYDETTQTQIKAQQQAIMQVQTAIARSREAEQQAITVEQQGKANAATAKWEQEVIKAKEVTAAEQRKRVAELDAQTAEQYKRKQVLEGEGDAAKKRLVFEADGALAQKLETYVRAQEVWARAIAAYTGAWVPGVVFGGGGSGQAGSGAQQLLDMFAARVAKDLAVDISAKGAQPPASGKK